MSIPNVYEDHCGACGRMHPVDEGEDIRLPEGFYTMRNVCPECVAMWRAWERGECFIDNNGSMHYKV